MRIGTNKTLAPGGGAARRPRGRPRQFDPAQALTDAQDVFLEKGFSGTSLDDLAGAMGINRPSLYAAFGDKQRLYEAALDGFADTMRGSVRRALESGRNLDAALENFFLAALDVYFPTGGRPLGCLVMTTAVTEAPASPAIAQRVRRVLDEIDHALTERFRAAIAAGEIPRDADAPALGKLAAGVLHSLAVRVRAGTPRKTLKAFATEQARLVRRAAGAGKR